MNCDGSTVPKGSEPDEITITFGTGHITGVCMEDSICVGDACSKGTFIASTEESQQPFAAFAFDGLRGRRKRTDANELSFEKRHPVANST